MNSYTVQEAFDLVWDSVIKQGKPAALFRDGKFKGCRLRGEGDTKCAVGFLLDDKDYSERSEDMLWSNLPIDFTDAEDNSQVFAKLQGAHDQAARELYRNNADFVSVFKREMKMAAISLNVQVPIEK